MRGNTATIYPHHNTLQYGRSYIVKMDAAVLKPASGAFAGFDTDPAWTFTTKAAPPRSDATRLVVSADGTGDFNTVQGALDFVPAKPTQRVTVFIRNGNYEEIVYLRGKSNLTIRGEDRDKTVVGYRNNSAFNRTRPAFTVTEATDIQLSTFTINNYFIGQAEALLIRGQRNVVDRMTLNGSGDAFTTYGTIYMVDSKLHRRWRHDPRLCGALSACAARFTPSGLSPGRGRREGNHGNVFVDSRSSMWTNRCPGRSPLLTLQDGSRTGVLARLPRNGPAGSANANFPNAEMVLINARTSGVPPEGWGPLEDRATFDWANVRFWEYNTLDMEGRPIDMSKRHPIVRELTMPRDAETIANYRNPEFVLGGWKPVIHEPGPDRGAK